MKDLIKTLIINLVAITVFSVSFTGCKDDDEVKPSDDNNAIKSYQATIRMSQLSNGMAVSLRADTVKPFMNKKGQAFNISRLRYLISDFTFHRVDGSSFKIDDYHFIDIADSSTQVYTPIIKVPEGNYSSISFTFGFDEKDNTPDAYSNLNIMNWNWPAMLGNGYHYMQLEGKYDSLGNDRFYATHMGTARDISDSNNVIYENNHFKAQLAKSNIIVNSDFSFEIVMNVEQWYENPFEWDFTIYNAPIMPIYAAQKRLNENGITVFSILKDG